MNPPPVPPDDAAPQPLLRGMNLGGLFSIGMSDAAAALDPEQWQPPSAEALAHSIAGFHITHLIGRGGMGAVYAARQLSLDRQVAIKILPREASLDEAFVQRFHREARTLGRLQHSGIVAVHDFGTTPDGCLFIVMEFVEGTTLHDLIHGGHLQVGEALEIVKQICEALAYAHAQGVVHRDIKPTNILLDRQGRVKVADFGLAKLSAHGPGDARSPTPQPSIARTRTGVGLGTPDYAAPEQIRGQVDVDHRADIYSLGVMFYEMLTGSVPRGYFDPPSKRRGTDARLDEVVLRAMHEQPAQRYQQATALRDDVTRVQSRAGGEMPRWQRPGSEGGSVKRWLLVALVTGLAVVGMAVVYLKAERPSPSLANPSSSLPVTSQAKPQASVSPPQQAPAAPQPSPPAKAVVAVPDKSPASIPAAALPKPSIPPAPVPQPKPQASPVAAPSLPAAMPGANPSPASTLSPTDKTSLLAQAKAFGQRRYALVANAMPWAQAQAFAKAQGGKLATASNREITAWLAANLSSQQRSTVLLGGQCWMPGGAWEWDSGEEWSHAEWPAATPFFGVLALDAQGQWQALSFDEARPFIIEWPAN